MSAANYEHCPGCGGKALYTGEEDVPGGVEIWHSGCREKAEAAAAKRERERILSANSEFTQMCWQLPAGWDMADPVPRCNRLAGHEPPHICHVIWGSAGVRGIAGRS